MQDAIVKQVSRITYGDGERDDSALSHQRLVISKGGLALSKAGLALSKGGLVLSKTGFIAISIAGLELSRNA